MEHRRSRRFSLCLPLAIRRAGLSNPSCAGLTRNISSGGVLFAAEDKPDLGGPIEYVITLNPDQPQHVNLHCMGKVLRCEEDFGSDFGYAVAATLERYEFVRPE